VSERSIRRARRRRTATVSGAGAVLGVGALFAPAAQADTLIVDSLEDDGSGGTTLREAIDEANTNGEPDVITFASTLTGTIELGSSLEITNEELEIQGPGAGQIIVDAQGNGTVFYVTSLDDFGTPVTISGLTLTGGQRNNGGAIESIPGTDSAANLTLTDLVITGNEAATNGAGVFVNAGGSVSITNSVISNNSAGAEGGGVYVVGIDGDVTIRGSVFSGNEAGAEGGGAHLYDNSGDVLIQNTTFATNVADAYGGGAGLYHNDTVTIEGSTFAGNEAEQGGGGFVLWGQLDSALVQNTTISSNSAGTRGGGAYLYSEFEDARVMRNSTVVGNTAGESGGGLYLALHDLGSDVEVNLTSTIVANNSAEDLASAEGEDGRFIADFSLIESAGTAALTEGSPTNLFNTDPELGPLQNNGGPTQTHLPVVTSPVVDKGTANGLATDQRGLARTGDLSLAANSADGTDIGAVELQAADCLGAGALRIDGTEGDDTLTGTDTGDSIAGLGGNDSVNAAGGNDCVSGDGGKDRLQGKGGSDRLTGDAGKDTLKAGGGRDRASGGGGKDRLSGQGGKDRLKGGPGKDRLKGGPGKDKLVGGGGKDRFNCGGGKDKVTAQAKDKVSASCEKVVERG
jgi:Ca2+-binding RTX toxin-like protein